MTEEMHRPPAISPLQVSANARVSCYLQPGNKLHERRSLQPLASQEAQEKWPWSKAPKDTSPEDWPAHMGERVRRAKWTGLLVCPDRGYEAEAEHTGQRKVVRPQVVESFFDDCERTDPGLALASHLTTEEDQNLYSPEF